MISTSSWTRLTERMERLDLFEVDIDEQFLRSGGRGGQNVNKVNSCVYLLHRPTGTEVKCQKTRSQHDNRYWARVILCERIEAERLGKESAQERERYRIRKQKARRSRKAKAKLLEEKRAHSGKKQARRPVTLD